MKRLLGIGLTLIVAFALTGSALAVPRLQTYIVGSSYYNNYSFMDRRSWITSNSYFDMKVVGYWKQANNAGGFTSAQSPPVYDYMDTYLAISVPRNEFGRIWINGVEVSSFTNYRDAVPHGVRPGWQLPLSRPSIFGKFNFSDIGRIDNNQINAYHYDHGMIRQPGWGDEILLNVVVNGYSWAHFDAVGVDAAGRTYTNPGSHDAGYFGTPEPGTLSLLGVGLLGMVPLLRRKRK
jgi:hypothetical protein